MSYYTWRYSATGYNRKVSSPRRNTRKYLGPSRIERSPIKIPVPAAAAAPNVWWTSQTSVVGPAGMSNSQYA